MLVEFIDRIRGKKFLYFCERCEIFIDFIKIQEFVYKCPDCNYTILKYGWIIRKLTL